MCVIRTAPATICSPPYVRSCESNTAAALMAALHPPPHTGVRRRRACVPFWFETTPFVVLSGSRAWLASNILSARPHRAHSAAGAASPPRAGRRAARGRDTGTEGAITHTQDKIPHLYRIRSSTLSVSAAPPGVPPLYRRSARLTRSLSCLRTCARTAAPRPSHSSWRRRAQRVRAPGHSNCCSQRP